ncbi:hypothetical protein [Streptosporangium sp. NPDC006930]|uniref:hypothetical protein n=1 Tax=Streptosporangium sp. NPDC006930 TaxID=3154783 RepID=UPI00341C73E8
MKTTSTPPRELAEVDGEIERDGRQLAADIARLDRLSPGEVARETARAERADALGHETDNDRTYRAALEKRAR